MKIGRNIFFISFIILFLESLLIRYISTEIRIFAYLSNLVLMVIFVGSGIGMMVKKRMSLSVAFISLFILTIILWTGLFSPISEFLSPLSSSFIWFQSDISSVGLIFLGLILTTIIIILLLLTFIPLGQYLGNLLEMSRKPVMHYSINVIASILGMWSFYLLSFLSFSPLIGILIIMVLMLFLSFESEINNQIIIGLICVSVVVSIALIGFANPPDNSLKTYWSLYQKLSLFELAHSPHQAQGYMVKVNNVGYMGLIDLSLKYQKSLYEKLGAKTVEKQNLKFTNQYDLPYMLTKGKNSDVLIIGAGGGNDAAGAIRSGAGRIDAVEIDSAIIALGSTQHPEKPYDSNRVNIIVDDGRAFIKRTNKKYDIVIMGLADSHTLGSTYANIQLDNYLYTTESFKEIHRLLKPNGILFATFDVRRDWIGGHIRQGLYESFGHKPYIFNLSNNGLFGWGGVVFVIDKDNQTIAKLISNNKLLATFINDRLLNFTTTNSLSDNWPYLYLDKPRVPALHIFISIIFVLLVLFFYRGLRTREFGTSMFLLGAGFLLYESQNISRAALIFGNTWTTNIFIITFVLILILLANTLYLKFKLPAIVNYFLLFLTLILQLVVPIDIFNLLPFFIKMIAATLFMCLPFYFSASIFIDVFNHTKNRSSALAYNLLGSAFGGVLCFLSYLFGMKSLIIISMILYLLSFIATKLKRLK